MWGDSRGAGGLKGGFRRRGLQARPRGAFEEGLERGLHGRLKARLTGTYLDGTV